MTTTHSWNVHPSKFNDLVDSDISGAVVQLAEKVFNGVVSRTPVFSGSLRASWEANSSGTGEAVVGGSEASPLAAPDFPSGLRSSKAKILYVVNTTPYGRLVEFGGPTNSPRAMVRNTLNSL